jgi:maleamate amidohydrolase
MSEVYAARGYGATPVGFGEKPGVVVVDFQRGFTDSAFPMGGAPMIDRAVENTVRVIRAAKAAGLPVAACVAAFDGPGAMPHWKVAPVRELMRGTPATELDPRIAAAEPDLVVAKVAPSIFFQTPVATYLTKERVDTVVVTGCVTSGCVRASIVDAFSLGFRTIVPEDCVGDHDEEPHRANLRDVERRYADISSAEAVIAEFARWAGRNDRR